MSLKIIENNSIRSIGTVSYSHSVVSMAGRTFSDFGDIQHGLTLQFRFGIVQGH